MSKEHSEEVNGLATRVAEMETALKQALEALEFIRQWGEPALGVQKRDAAITTARQALGANK